MFGEYATRLTNNGELRKFYLPPFEYRDAYLRFTLMIGYSVNRFFSEKGTPVRARFRPTTESINCPIGCLPTSPMRLEIVYDGSIIGNIMLSNNQIKMMDSVEVIQSIIKYMLNPNIQHRIEFAKIRATSARAYELAY